MVNILSRNQIFGWATGLLCCLTTAVANAQPLLTDSSTNPEPLQQTETIQVTSSENHLISQAIEQLNRGELDAAAQNAAKAYSEAQTQEERLLAARVAATAHFQSEHFTRAEWWLRRAANHTQTPQQATLVGKEFQAVRERNPMDVRLSFSVAPSDNINNGARSEFFSLGEIQLQFPPNSLAMSGIEYSGNLDLSYRLSQGQRHVTTAGLQLYGRTYSLSNAARDRAPNVSGSDFALYQVSASLSHRRFLFKGLGPSGVTFHAGKLWYGGEVLRRFNRVTLSQDFSITPDTALFLQGFVEKQYSLSPLETDANIHEVQGTLAYRFGNLDVLRVGLRRRFHHAELETFTFSDRTLVVEYDRAQPLFSVRLGLDFQLGHKAFDEYFLSFDGRRDDYISMDAKAVFENFTYFGFAPSLTVSASRTNSNVARFTTKELFARVEVETVF